MPLFRHPGLERLELHWAESANNLFLFCDDNEGPCTNLKDLKLIDCRFEPGDLSVMLQFPRSLHTLSIWSDLDPTDLLDNQMVNHEDFFQVISTSSSCKDLKGLRVDFLSRRWIIVPAPGMDKLLHVKCLEVNPEHLLLKAQEHEEYPNIDCPLDRLFPPSLEVLKITPFDPDSDRSIIFDILEQKSKILPFLRKLILTNHYRDEKMAQELKDAVAKDHDRRNYNWSLQAIHSNYQLYKYQDPMDEVKSLCKHENVELVLLYEDSVRKEILREGAGRAVWEMPEQIR